MLFLTLFVAAAIAIISQLYVIISLLSDLLDDCEKEDEYRIMMDWDEED